MVQRIGRRVHEAALLLTDEFGGDERSRALLIQAAAKMAMGGATYAR